MSSSITNLIDDDDAMDFLATVERSRSADHIQRALDRLLGLAEDAEAPDASRAITACEAIATRRGHPPEDVSDELLRWAAKKGVADNDCVDQATEVIRRIRRGSELRGLFEESGHLEGWNAALDDLAERLNRTPVDVIAPDPPPRVKTIKLAIGSAICLQSWEWADNEERAFTDEEFTVSIVIGLQEGKPPQMVLARVLRPWPNADSVDWNWISASWTNTEFILSISGSMDVRRSQPAAVRHELIDPAELFIPPHVVSDPTDWKTGEAPERLPHWIKTDDLLFKRRQVIDAGLIDEERVRQLPARTGFGTWGRLACEEPLAEVFSMHRFACTPERWEWLRALRAALIPSGLDFDY